MKAGPFITDHAIERYLERWTNVFAEDFKVIAVAARVHIRELFLASHLVHSEDGDDFYVEVNDGTRAVIDPHRGRPAK